MELLVAHFPLHFDLLQESKSFASHSAAHERATIFPNATPFLAPCVHGRQRTIASNRTVGRGAACPPNLRLERRWKGKLISKTFYATRS